MQHVSELLAAASAARAAVTAVCRIDVQRGSKRSTTTSSGTGLLVAGEAVGKPDQVFVMTNSHVLEHSRRAYGKVSEAELIEEATEGARLCTCTFTEPPFLPELRLLTPEPQGKRPKRGGAASAPAASDLSVSLNPARGFAGRNNVTVKDDVEEGVVDYALVAMDAGEVQALAARGIVPLKVSASASGKLRPGDVVRLVGHADGSKVAGYSEGKVVAFHRGAEVQHSAYSTFGLSGGPLLDGDGALVGLQVSGGKEVAGASRNVEKRNLGLRLAQIVDDATITLRAFCEHGQLRSGCTGCDGGGIYYCDHGRQRSLPSARSAAAAASASTGGSAARARTAAAAASASTGGGAATARSAAAAASASTGGSAAAARSAAAADSASTGGSAASARSAAAKPFASTGCGAHSARSAAAAASASTGGGATGARSAAAVIT